MSPEYLLILVIIVFYLLDSVILLYGNEILLTESNGKWNLLFPNKNFFILNKLLYVPNPLIPCNPLFRIYWSNVNVEIQTLNEESLNDYIRVLAPLKLMTVVLYSCLIFGLPIALTGFGTGMEFFILLLVIYINIFTIIVYLGFNRDKFDISLKKYIFIIFESFVCAPYAINLVRKLSLSHFPSGSVFISLKNILDPEAFKLLNNSLLAYIDDKIILESDEDYRGELQQIRQAIIKLQK